MTLSESKFQDHKSIYKKCLQVRLAIIEMMNEGKNITIGLLSEWTGITKRAVYNHVQELEQKGEIVTNRQGEGTKGEILHMYLTKYAIDETYDRILTSIPENDRERVLSILEKKVKNKNFRKIT
jgi:predicted ArsR family transcriptional regulator